MGCECSRSKEDHVASSFQPVSTVQYTLRKPNVGEIEELANSISLESFSKDRLDLLRKLQPIELSVQDFQLILRALKTDTERMSFITEYTSNCPNLTRKDVSKYLRTPKAVSSLEKTLMTP